MFNVLWLTIFLYVSFFILSLFSLYCLLSLSSPASIFFSFKFYLSDYTLLVGLSSVSVTGGFSFFGVIQFLRHAVKITRPARSRLCVFCREAVFCYFFQIELFVWMQLLQTKHSPYRANISFIIITIRLFSSFVPHTPHLFCFKLPVLPHKFFAIRIVSPLYRIPDLVSYKQYKFLSIHNLQCFKSLFTAYLLMQTFWNFMSQTEGIAASGYKT